jgi:hypothetical protein
VRIVPSLLPRTPPLVRRLFLPLLVAALPALGGCRVERTPREFYTQRDPAQVDQRDDDKEIRARVRNFAVELASGNRGRALTALNPADEVLVIGADGSGGVSRIGIRGLAEALDSLTLPTRAVARTADLRVEVGLRESTGWFSTPIEFLTMGSADSAPRWLRASGIYKQDRGEWKLVQLHLSRPFVAPDTTRADSASTDSARRATAAARSRRR